MRVGLISGDDMLQVPSLRYLSSFLNKNGHETHIFFMQKLSPTVQIAAGLPKGSLTYSQAQIDAALTWARGFGLIGISCMSLTAERAHQLAKALRQTDIPVVWGGPHATVLPEDCLASVDIVCRGEGEHALLELADALENKRPFHTLRNLFVRHAGTVRRNDLRPLVEDLDTLGGHDYDLSRQWVLDGEIIRPFVEGDLGGVLCLNTMRGCPHRCAYCWWSLHHALYRGKGPRVRKRSPRDVIAEIGALKKKFPSVTRVLFLNEDDFLYTPEELRIFATGWKEGVGLPFCITTSPLTLTREKMEAYLSAGMIGLALGVQSGSDRILRIYNRPMYQKYILDAARILEEYRGCTLLTYQFLYNCCYERREDLLATIGLVASLKPPFIFEAFNVTYIPGTALHRRALRDGLLRGRSSLRLNRHAYDLGSHLQATERVPNPYLLHLIQWCTGHVTRWRVGVVPRSLLPSLTVSRVIDFFDSHPGLLAAPDAAFRKAMVAVNSWKIFSTAARRMPAVPFGLSAKSFRAFELLRKAGERQAGTEGKPESRRE